MAVGAGVHTHLRGRRFVEKALFARLQRTITGTSRCHRRPEETQGWSPFLGGLGWQHRGRGETGPCWLMG